MKKIAIIGMLIFLLILTAIGQVPEKFNYQGVLRNTSGDLVKNASIKVKISLLLGSTDGAVQYSENHTVSTNNYGQFVVKVGEGTDVTGVFATIDWSQQIYLKTEVANPAGGTLVDMGTVQLISVPYALYSDKAKTLDKSTIYVTDNDTLFAVKDRDGNIVFAVFPDGAQVYTSLSTKGKVGGFAVSGRTPTKEGELIEYFRVTPDSTRIYVNDSIASKGTVGGFAISGRTPTKGGIKDYFTVNKDSTRIYISDSLDSKGKVGGFAVSGRTPTKDGEAAKFMDMTKNNYFIGHEAGKSNISGLYNSFIGYQSGLNNISGINNYFIGYRSGYNNINGYSNIFIGDSAGFSNTIGDNNLFIGGKAGFSNTVGRFNIAIGRQALNSNDSGLFNISYGYQSLYSNTKGSFNIANGYQSLYSNTTGTQNIAIGMGSLYSNITGDNNTAFGISTLYSNTIGYGNIAFGSQALYYNEKGIHNVAIGFISLNNNTTGNYNVSCGYASLINNTKGNNNVATGVWSLGSNTEGGSNVAVGYEALKFNVTGNYNTAIGYRAYFPTNYLEEYSNSTSLGANTFINQSNKVRLGDPIIEVIEGQVAYSFPSDGRFKTNVKEDVKGLDFITRLRPIIYNFDTQKFDEFLMKNAPDSIKNAVISKKNYTKSKAIRQSGFIAQEVEKAAEEAGFVFNGVHHPTNENDNYSLSYSLFTVPLVKAVQELNTKNEQLQLQILKLEEYNSELNNQLQEMNNRLEKLEK